MSLRFPEWLCPNLVAMFGVKLANTAQTSARTLVHYVPRVKWPCRIKNLDIFYLHYLKSTLLQAIAVYMVS